MLALLPAARAARLDTRQLHQTTSLLPPMHADAEASVAATDLGPWSLTVGSQPLCSDALHKGMSTSRLAWDATNEFAINRTMCMGGNAIFIRIWCSQANLSSLEPQCPSAAPNETRGLVELLEQARCRGLSLGLQTELHSSDEGAYSTSLSRGVWAADIGSSALGQPAFSASQWEAWGAAWRAQIVPWAAFAAAHNVSLFSIGAELNSAQTQPSFYEGVVAAARAAYPASAGNLSYAADKGTETSVAWWGSIDRIGTDPYFQHLGSFTFRSWVGVGVGVVAGLLIGCLGSRWYVHVRRGHAKAESKAEVGTSSWSTIAACAACSLVLALASGAALGFACGLWNTDPDSAALAESWAAKTASLWALARSVGNPILIHEIGFRSLSGTNNNPGVWDTTGEANNGLQDRLLGTMLNEFCAHDLSEFAGVFVMGLEDDSVNPIGYELTGKPAIATIAAAWGGSAPPACAPDVVARIESCRQ